MQEALKIKGFLDQNPDFSKSKIPKRLRLSRARISQMMSLFELAPDIQEQVLISNNIYSERQLRPLTRIKCHDKQCQIF